MYFCANEFEVGVNDSIFSGNEQQKVYIACRYIFDYSPPPPPTHTHTNVDLVVSLIVS